MRAFYGTRFSPNMTKTLEGFLICHNVPIARTGWQDYLPQEIGLPGDEIIKVYRSEEEVFSQATIASFEGKPVTNEHPSQEVRPDNVSAYGKGHAQHVRRGSGEYTDMLLADLFVTDPILIAEIEAGKREVSCGYDCDYVQANGRYEQQKISGNHIAVVPSGRAGSRIAIKDSKPEKQRGKNKMKFSEHIIRALGWKKFVEDASPEELAEAMKSNGEPKAKDEELHNEKKEENFNAQILAAIQALQADVAELKAGKAPAEAKDSLTELEEEMTNGKADPETTDENHEASVTIPVEEMKNEDGSKVMDKAAVLAAIKAVKPFIAKLPEAERRTASDALSKELRAAMGKPDPTKDQNPYAALLKTKKTADAKKADSGEDFGNNCAKRNPHIKGAK